MTVLESLVAPPAPLAFDEHGVLRVGGTRVRLETVVTAFHAGSSPEEILLKYPTLDLTDIYAVITYYLWHRADLDSYLAERTRTVEASQREIETRFPTNGIRARLLARREARQ
jgi:uncharacterized protein (DUF433 family)